MESSTYSDRKVIQQSRMFVNVVAHSETGHGTKEIVEGRDKKTVCKLYETITCEEHAKLSKQAVGKFFSGSFGTPTTVFCGPDGEELFRQKGSMGAADLTKKMDEALRKVKGEKISWDLWNLARRQIAEGDELMQNEKYSKAISTYKKVARMKQKGLQALGEEALARAEEKGRELLEEAKRKIEADEKDEAKKLLGKIKKEFRGLDVSKEATTLLKEMK